MGTNTKKVYIAGKVTGLNYREAFTEFKKIEKDLIGQGYEVINPLEIVPSNNSWEDAMKICIRELTSCYAIYLLPNWHQSRGAKLEAHIASELGLEFTGEESCKNTILKIN
ncbi:protein of unknown function (DUF4406) [Apibacter mensalis]|uniref:DUF4406 domain-containing protein n=1 Tax=Apibacter mensalis TaxID=1586267 RepID=A0A0X3ARM7_9FLAO|nr:DUF4406 domain-containing protein [Apibacter mensalis]CVK17100.1 protein of unknown function (DUF4406) [Apibacter mensalis]CVK17134.1 protein of unknown function (DUF4406) [Apibacter mensalis]